MVLLLIPVITWMVHIGEIFTFYLASSCLFLKIIKLDYAQCLKVFMATCLTMGVTNMLTLFTPVTNIAYERSVDFS